MTWYVIPLRSGLAHQVITITLSGRRYRIKLDWLGRLRRWSFSIYKADGTPISETRGLVLGTDLLFGARSNPDTPPGLLILDDSEGADEEATLSSLGKRHKLYYVES